MPSKTFFVFEFCRRKQCSKIKKTRELVLFIFFSIFMKLFLYLIQNRRLSFQVFRFRLKTGLVNRLTKAEFRSKFVNN